MNKDPQNVLSYVVHEIQQSNKASSALHYRGNHVVRRTVRRNCELLHCLEHCPTPGNRSSVIDRKIVYLPKL